MTVWLVLAMAFALAVGAAWVLVVDWLDDEQRSHAVRCRAGRPRSPAGLRPPW
jgi:hypothetical protein